MNNLKRIFNKNKKSVFSLLVALVLMLSFNYAPISLVADRIKTTNAYKATSTQSYYSTASNKSETNIGSAKYPTALKEYFKDSNNSFNIETYYNSRFLNIFGEKIDLYLRNVTDNDYNESYIDFLDYKNYKSLYNYYDSETTYIHNHYDCNSFYTFVEKFVTKQTDYDTTNANPKKVLPLFTKQTLNENRSDLYCALANYINAPTDEDKNVETHPGSGNWDNVASDASDSDFYKNSVSYQRVKDIIDAIIVETIAIYSYDNTTQNNIVGSIIANNAPTSSLYYYQDGSYVSENRPSFAYETKTTTVSGATVSQNLIYYFGLVTEINNEPVYTQLQNYFIIEKQSALDANVFQFRKIKSGEFGYIEGYDTYYKFTSIPFAKTNDLYDVYVLDNDVTSAEKSAYDSLGFKTVTSKELSDDTLGFYYYIPYQANNNTIYFQEIYGTMNDTFERFCELFAPEDNNYNSILYLKFKTNTTYNVYIDSLENVINNESIDAEAFKTKNPSYTYNVLDVVITDANRDDYFKITSSYSSYYKTNYTLYFKKVRVDYTELVTDESVYDGTFETKETPNIPYETTKVPSASYELNANGRLIFALVEDGSSFTNSKVYGTITQAELDNAANRNVYVEVPEFVYDLVYGTAEQTNKLYYKHKLKDANKIYIVPGESEKNPKDSEVYKNLYYTVITEAELKEDSSNYVAVDTTDPNYNANFKLYYRYDTTLEHKDIYVQNILTEDNAVYILDDSLTSTEASIYKAQKFIVIKNSEFTANKAFYFAVPEGDPRHSDTYKLYYKYNANAEKERVVYVYSTSTKETYPTFHSTSTDYVASDYVLVEPTDTDYYVEGTNLYFKRNRTIKYNNINQNTYYYYNNTSSVSLSANSYYMLSFYVNTTGENVEASVYLTDKNSAIKEIALEHISTNKAWVKYVAFIATDSITDSSVTLSLYMGDKNSILGRNYDEHNMIETITGSVLFDNINVYKINETDFTKKAFNDVVVENKEEQKDTVSGDVLCEVPVVVANNDSAFESQVFDNRTVNLTNGASWQKMFNFDNGTLINDIKNMPKVDVNTNGYTKYDDNILWHYYISRDVSSQGNNDKLTQYIDAYKNNDMFASVISEESIDKTPINVLDKEDEEKEESDTKNDSNTDSDDDKDKEDLTDVKSIESTFNSNNMVLKLQNKNRILPLGVASNTFTVRQHQYYKLTVWVYSPDEEATATLMVTSVIDTGSTPEYGSLQAATGTVTANIAGYTKEPTNEYGWIPISFYIEGNALHDQECNLVLMADKNRTIYFDNITIENVSSTKYNSASSDSDANTFVLSLVPTSALVTNGLTNGYFNLVSLESDYRNPSSITPKKAKNWELEITNSSSVIAGVVPTSKSYTDLTENFYTKYNNDGTIVHIPYSEGFDEDNSYNNVYAIYAPDKITAPIENAGSKTYELTNVYKIYSSSSMSVKKATTYDISFDFYKGYKFSGKMIANLYAGSVKAEKLISSFVIDYDDLTSYQWHTYHFYVAAATTDVSTYIEIGVENAVGTAFFKDISCLSVTESLDEIRDKALSSTDNNSTTSTTLTDKTSLTNLRFVNFNDATFSIVDMTPDKETNLHTPLDYTIDVAGKSEYTVGKGGTAVASYFDSEVTKSYSVTINKVTYYIGKVTDPETSEESYKLYKFSDLTEEVTEIDGSPVKVENFKKVVVGEGSSATENDSVETKKTNYTYYFTNKNLNEYVVNNVVIPTTELTNNYSDNVLILANSYTTDYTVATAKYTHTLSTSAYYVLRIYVKTSNFESDDIGLNIKVGAVATNWDNINTTKLDSSKLDENGFACYQALITTNTSSITNLSVTYSLGTSSVTGKGYAIIAGATLEQYSTVHEFDHYVEGLEEDDTTIKKFFGVVSSSSTDDKNATNEDEDTMSWITFFYVFSSLLLGITLIMAIVALFIKKHPIKLAKKYDNEHNRDADVLQITKKSKQEKNTTDGKDFDDNGKGGII